MNLQRILYNCHSRISRLSIWTLLLFLVGTALLGCERELDIDMDVEPPVVVNSLFNTDSTWRVRINKAWAMGEVIYGPGGDGPTVDGRQSKNIVSASVHITSGSGEQIPLDYDTNGYYLNPQKPRAGETYTLSVDVPGELPISASVVLPEPVWPDTAYFTNLPEYDEYLFTLEFTDPPGPTAYELNLYEGTSGSLRWAQQLETNDQDVYVEYYWTPDYDHPEGIGIGLGPIFWALNDLNFQGKKKTLVFRMHHFDEPSGDWTVQLRTLSDEYTRYRTTALKQQESYNDPFAQPVQVFNNINHGVGIFAGYSAVYYHFKVK